MTQARKRWAGLALIILPILFPFTLIGIYIVISLTFAREANRIAFAAGPLVGTVLSLAIWTTLLGIVIGVPLGIGILISSFRKKTRPRIKI
jgi:hypothetical protein